MPRRILNGKVVKKSGDKTVSVLVTRQTTHPIYKKIMRKIFLIGSGCIRENITMAHYGFMQLV